VAVIVRLLLLGLMCVLRCGVLFYELHEFYVMLVLTPANDELQPIIVVTFECSGNCEAHFLLFLISLICNFCFDIAIFIRSPIFLRLIFVCKWSSVVFWELRQILSCWEVIYVGTSGTDRVTRSLESIHHLIR